MLKNNTFIILKYRYYTYDNRQDINTNTNYVVKYSIYKQQKKDILKSILLSALN